MTPPFCLLIRWNCIKTIDYSISIYILLLHSYINSFTCSWHIWNRYHSPLKVHVTATYFILNTPVYWSRLGRNRYGTNRFLPSSYSRIEYLFRKRSVATSLVTSPQNHFNIACYYAVIRRPFMKWFPSHSFHSYLQHCDEQGFKRVRNRSGTA